MLLLCVSVVVFLAGFEPVTSDTPAHCLYEQIAGEWTFSETERSYTKSNISCDTLGPVARSIKITLSYPNIAEDEFGIQGTWTMIYNQGFEVEVNGRTYFAFSMYEQVKNKLACKRGDPTGCKIQEVNKVVSHCDKTLVGWSHDVLVNNWACFQGDKVQPLPTTTHTTTHKIRTGLYKVNHDFLKAINNSQSSWWTRAYSDFEKLTHEEMILMHGGRSSYVRSPPRPAPVTEETLNKVQDLPAAFDWSDVDGVNYVNPVRNQGQCGSCYIFGSVAAIEARLRIATNNELKVTLSQQDVISCSKYSQGCGGGFPYLTAGKYGKDFGFVEDSCDPYEAKDTPCESNDCPRHYTASYRYIGGYYGACNEGLMQIALVADGPLVVNFQVMPDFHSYSGGIYHYTGIQDEFNPFEEVNHSVLIVGYGADAETGEKFWRVQNSWGGSWGEAGFFRIRRGDDQCNIESLTTEVFPIP